MDIFQKNIDIVVIEHSKGNSSQAARDLEISQQNIANWRAGISYPTVTALRKFEKFGINLNWLVIGKGKQYLWQEQEMYEKEHKLRLESEERERMKDKEIEELKRKESIYLSMFEKDLQKDKNVNFNDVDISNHLVDRLEEFNKLSDVNKNFWTSHSFLADMIDLTRND